MKHSRGETQVRFSPYVSSVASENTFWICDQNVASFLKASPERVFQVWAQESNKNLGTVESICTWLAGAGATREATLVAIGGGVIQDIATMSASIFMRGIKWEYVPTTTNAMLDSCIGGKSSLNSLHYKNLIGNFHPPQKVHIDVSLLQSLGVHHYLSGVLEGIKIVSVANPGGLETFIQELRQSEYRLSPALISLVLSYKKEIVEEDEFDTGRRLLLNYGHTFGHALERASSFKIPHGVAIGIGMLTANRQLKVQSNFVRGIGLVTTDILGRLKTDHLPGPQEIDWGLFQKAFEKDKKHSSSTYRIVAPVGDKLAIVEMAKSEANIGLLTSLIQKEYESLWK